MMLFWCRASLRSPATEKMEKKEKKKKKEKKSLKMLEARHCHREWWRMGFKRAFDDYVYGMNIFKGPLDSLLPYGPK